MPFEISKSCSFIVVGSDETIIADSRLLIVETSQYRLIDSHDENQLSE